MRKLVIILLSIVLPVMHVLSYAEKSITEEEIFDDLRGKSFADSLSKSDSLLLLLKEEEDRRNAWGLSVEGNFIGDEADDKTTADLYISAEITKGEFPRQFRFTVESKIGLEDYKLGDDVTALLLNYDYYVHPFVEVYAFIERFSDSYMDIKQRFEIGFGIKLEGTLLGLVDHKDTELIERLPWPDTLLDTLTSERKDTLKHYKETALTSIKKRDARLKAGIAFSFFEELEQAEIV